MKNQFAKTRTKPESNSTIIAPFKESIQICEKAPLKIFTPITESNPSKESIKNSSTSTPTKNLNQSKEIFEFFTGIVKEKDMEIQRLNQFKAKLQVERDSYFDKYQELTIQKTKLETQGKFGGTFSFFCHLVTAMNVKFIIKNEGNFCYCGESCEYAKGFNV
jgi:hypothetical protein